MELLEQLLTEIRELKHTILAGYNERAYEMAQNLDDELTTEVLIWNQELERAKEEQGGI